MTHTPSNANAPVRTPVIMRFTDGKAGHHNQTTGLLDALESRLGTIEAHDFNIASMSISMFGLMRFYAVAPGHFPRADLWIGAGRATHSHMIAAAKYRGGRSVVCMDPGRWHRWRFDLCLIPEHDDVPESDKVVVTRGALNHILPSHNHDSNNGVILIGGPSKHYKWEHERLCALVAQIVANSPSVSWELTTSRRTPEETQRSLCALPHSNLAVTLASQTPADWVATRLAIAAQCWVTEDSVSMVYEALTAGTRVGILPVPRRRTSRVARGIDALLDDNSVARWDTHVVDLLQRQAAAPLHEADRCAGIIIERLLS